MIYHDLFHIAQIGGYNKITRIYSTKNKFGKLMKAVRFNAQEYIGDSFENYITKNGIEHQLNVPYCSPRNGVSEGKNRTIVEMACTMLLDQNISGGEEAVLIANCLLNQLKSIKHLTNCGAVESQIYHILEYSGVKHTRVWKKKEVIRI